MKASKAPPTPLSTTDSELPQVSITPVAPATERGRRIALGILLLLSFLSVAELAAPVWIGLVLGCLMAFTMQPMYRQIAVYLGDRRSIAAALTTLVTGIACSLLGGITLYVLSRELFTLVALLQQKLGSGSLPTLIGERGAHLMKHLGVNQEELIKRVDAELSHAANSAASAAALILQTTSTAVLGLIVALMTMYYVLLEWPSIPVRLERVLPLDPRHTRALVLEFRSVGRSALIGTLATALIQGCLGVIGYAVADVPHSITWGLLTALTSFVPVIGTMAVWLPVSLYLISIGHLGFAIFEVAWGLLVIMATTDYVIRPRIVGSSSSGQGHPLLMLVALLGGLEVFGLGGLVVGPVLMSLFLAIFRIYEREMATSSLHSHSLSNSSQEPSDPLVDVLQLCSKRPRSCSGFIWYSLRQ